LSAAARISAISFAALLSIAVAGCAAYKRIDDAPNVAEEAFRIAVDQADGQRQGRSPIHMAEDPWISIKKVEPAQPKATKLPAKQDCRIRLIADTPLALADFAQIVTADCQVPVWI